MSKSLTWVRKNVFGVKVSPEKMLRKNQRALSKAIRDIEREKLKMEGQEKVYIAEIKRLAKAGQMESVKIMAKNLVQTRRYVKKFMLMKANLQSVEMKIVALRSQNSISEAMKNVTIILRSMNASMKIPRIKAILREFEKQSVLMDMHEEVVNEAIEENLEGEDDEEVSDGIVTEILEELGLQLTEELGNLPVRKTSQKDGKKGILCPDGGAGSGSGGADDVDPNSKPEFGLGGNLNSNSNANDSDLDAEIRNRLDNLKKR